MKSKKVAEVRSELLQEIDETKSARDALVTESENRLAELDEATNRLAELENALAIKTGTIEQIKVALLSSEEKNAALAERVEHLSRDLARSELRMEHLPSLTKANEEMREELSHERGQRNDAEKEVARLASIEGQLASIMSQSDAAKVNINELREALNASELAQREATINVKNSELNISSLQVRLARAEKRSDDAELNAARIIENFLQLDIRSPMMKNQPI